MQANHLWSPQESILFFPIQVDSLATVVLGNQAEHFNISRSKIVVHLSFSIQKKKREIFLLEKNPLD